MQVATNFFVNKSINTTTVLTESPTKNFDCTTFFKNYIDSGGFTNCKKLLNTIYTTIFNYCNELHVQEQTNRNHNELMCDQTIMSGANCKRYLQNKLIDRKRRRPNSALAEPTNIDERSETTTRLRQTRQAAQRNLSSSSNFGKSYKTDFVQSRLLSSKKILRSNKQDVLNEEQLRDDGEFKNRSTPTEYNTRLREPGKQDIDTMYLANGKRDYKNETKMTTDNNKKNETSYVEQKGKELVEEKDQGQNEEKDDDEEKNYCSSKPPTLIDFNDNPRQSSSHHLEECGFKSIDSESSISHDIFLKNNDDLSVCGGNTETNNVIDMKKSSSYTENQMIKPINDIPNDISCNKIPQECGNDNDSSSDKIQLIEMPLVLKCEHMSSKPYLSSLDDKEKVEYENDLSRLSNSLCSDISSNSSCKQMSVEVNEDFSNEYEQRLAIGNLSEQLNQKHQVETSNTTTIRELTTKHPHTANINDESIYHRNTDESNGIENPLRRTPPLILPAINNSSPSPQIKQDTSNMMEINSKLCKSFHQENSIEENPKSSVAEDTDNIKESHFNNPKASISICDISHGNNYIDNLKLDSDSNINLQSISNTALKNDERQENGNQKHSEQGDQNFAKFLGSSQNQHSEFETQQNNVTRHQQHEKDIIDAADKVYTQIEEQQQYHQHIPSTYEHMINNHQHNQHDHHEPQQQRLDVDRQQESVHIVAQSHQLHAQQHSLQQHYSPLQLYHLQQEHHHHHQLHQEMQKEDTQQQSHHPNISQNQSTDQRRQQHSHMMDFLHPQHHPTASTHSPLHQQQQIHEVYHDLMMDEFHDEHNTPYKLGLSPSTVKPENQDDGYETSAGDVLTPNSHASSTHSVTPQHHLQHGTGGLISSVVKCEDQHQQHMQMQQQQSHHNSHLINDQNQNLHQELTAGESTTNITTRDPYHFIDDDLNSASNNSLRNILTPPHSHTRGNSEAVPLNFMAMQSDTTTNNINASNDMYVMANSSVNHHSIKPPCMDLNSSTVISNTDHQQQQQQQHFAGTASTDNVTDQDVILNLEAKPLQKRRGRKKKIPEGEFSSTLDRSDPNDANSVAGFTKTKERKKHDRFNGLSEEEVVKRVLPDHLCDNLDIVIIGINPGLFAAYKGHHYAGPGNHFWKCLYLSGLTQEQMNAEEDFKLIKYGIGFTNMVQRATKGSADLTRKEIKEGSRILLEKLQRFRPKIAVFNGKLIFEVFSGKKDFNFGRQPECVEGTDTFIWVMPSSSARCAQLPRAADKVPFYAALKKFRDYLNGLIPHIDPSECVFTEERIKQQCEQENYKNQQNKANLADSFQNATSILNTDGPMQNIARYSFDTETNPHGAGGGPGPPPIICNGSNSFMMSSLVGGQQEKKKRGRPKKIKSQEIIDPATGNKIQVNRCLLTPNGSGEYQNILNLSLVQAANSEMPKKKRGRPKKVKPQSNISPQETQSSAQVQKPNNTMSIQAITSDIKQGSPQRNMTATKQQHLALYSTPPHQERSIYSPMASPSLNCSYTTNTPPSQPLHDKLGITRNERESAIAPSTSLVSTPHHKHQLSNQHLGESPPPSSPNICAVDFEPPTAVVATPSNSIETVNSELNVMQHRLQTNHQRSRFNSPINSEPTPDHNTSEHFQQWFSPQHSHIHSPAPATSAMFANSPQQNSLHYHDHQQSVQQQQQHQDIHAQWPLRHQSRFDNIGNSPYLLSSPQLHPHHHANHHQSLNTGSSDVARKSLSGLESLVDQIPTISESESMALSSTAAVNAQVAAAAAVENRLQVMQNSLSDTQVGDSNFSTISGQQNPLTASNSPTSVSNSTQIQQSSTPTNLLNSNFSVSNLAASSASSSSNNNNNSQESYALTSNVRPLSNSNAAYHHTNLMAAAVLAAAAANSPTNLSTSTTANATAAAHHAQMYMDPHAHLTTHVPVNSIYPTAPSHHHPATAAHHVAVAHHHAAAASHYGSSVQHSPADYVSNPYAATQTNVATGHTLHMPSPNYPYGYTTASSQSNYSAYPHSHAATHHGHSHATHHTTHHLAMFDRLKPSDITGYTSF